MIYNFAIQSGTQKGIKYILYKCLRIQYFVSKILADCGLMVTGQRTEQDEVRALINKTIV